MEPQAVSNLTFGIELFAMAYVRTVIRGKLDMRIDFEESNVLEQENAERMTTLYVGQSRV